MGQAGGVLYAGRTTISVFALFHPVADRLFSLVKKTIPRTVGGDIFNVVGDIKYACETCREFPKRPFRVRAAVPADGVIINQEIAMGLMRLEGRQSSTWSIPAHTPEFPRH